MLSLNSDTQADISEAFNNTSRYLDDIFNIDNRFFDTLFPFIYPKELCLNKTSGSNISAPFLGLDLSMINGIISSKIYDKRDISIFDIVNYPHLDGDVPSATSYGIYISQVIRMQGLVILLKIFTYAAEQSQKKLLKQGYRYQKLRKTFSKFYFGNLPLISKHKCNLKTLLRQGISYPEFYADVIDKLRKILGHEDFENHFYKRIN